MPKPTTASAALDERFYFDCRTCGTYDDGFEGTERFEKQLCRGCYGKKTDTLVVRSWDVENEPCNSWFIESG